MGPSYNHAVRHSATGLENPCRLRTEGGLNEHLGGTKTRQVHPSLAPNLCNMCNRPKLTTQTSDANLARPAGADTISGLVMRSTRCRGPVWWVRRLGSKTIPATLVRQRPPAQVSLSGHCYAKVGAYATNIPSTPSARSGIGWNIRFMMMLLAPRKQSPQ